MITEAVVFLVGGASSMGVLYGSKKLRKKRNNWPLIGQTGRLQRAVGVGGLSANGARKQSKEEKEAIKYLTGNLGSLALFIVSNLYPVARIPAIVLTVYACVPIFKRAYPAVVSLVKDRQIKNDLLNGLVVTGTLVSQRFIVTAAYCFIANLGSVLVQKSKGYSEEMLQGVFNRKVTTVWMLRDDAEIETPIEQVDTDDVIVIHTGDWVPLDGRVVKGAITVDQHMLTGESIPVEKTIDDQVFASTVVIAGHAWVKVTETGQNTVVAKIENVLQGTSHFKTGLQLKGEKWADGAATPILGLGVILSPFQGLGVATAVFNTSPGNGIRMSASAQTLTHIILASHESILIKDGRVLEQLMEVDTVVFDKTGTLTEDKFDATRIMVAHDDYGASDVLFFAAAIEQRVGHPLAKAIIAKANAEGIVLPELDHSDAKYEIGKGVSATVNGKRVQVGSLSFMEKSNLSMPEDIDKDVREAIANGSSVVMVVIDEEIVGAIEMQAQLREEVKDVIASLRERGMKNLYILSGDHMEPTRQMARVLDLDGYFHNVSPEEKSSVIEQLQQEGKRVCFIGDGINDVIAMKKANVSISMTGASSIATDVAQVILMSGSLVEMDRLVELAQQLKRKLILTITSYTAVCSVSLVSIVFLGAPPFLALLTQSAVSDTFGLTQAVLPLKQLRDRKKRELHKEEEKCCELAEGAMPTTTRRMTEEASSRAPGTAIPEA